MANLFRCGGETIKTQTKTRFVVYGINYDEFTITFEQLTEVIGLSYFEKNKYRWWYLFNDNKW